MKTRSLGFVMLVVLVAISMSGCGCFQQQMRGEAAPPKAPEQAQAVAPEAKPVAPVVKETPSATAVPGIALNDINFDFDKYNIREKDAAILRADAPWFKANAGKRMRIEGHCDERGTVEYNLVLGQKRADSTKNFLVNLGIDGKYIETVSYGKEKPLDPGHNEEAWAKNRRAHFVPNP
ncbi:MAG TPA: peptidoglycan-associated lipoprotein Pal [Syntrophorhabdaceae bacterium]|nr:peptidoglycan-associated lipoprotein Pal [Syntrophorhabdaceae bacterium]